jgi:hypothetical protein
VVAARAWLRGLFNGNDLVFSVGRDGRLANVAFFRRIRI